MAQARNETILDKQRLDVLTLQSVFYVVQGNNNYHAHADSILALIQEYINRVTLNIDNVDNTSDANKPISTAVAQALAGKVSESDISDLRSQIENAVSTTKHTEDISLLWNAINSAVGLTPEQVGNMVDSVVGPVLLEVAALTERFNNYVTLDSFDQHNQTVQLSLNDIFGRLVSAEGLIVDMSTALSVQQQRVDGVEGDINVLRGEVEQQTISNQEMQLTVSGMESTVVQQGDRLFAAEQKLEGYDQSIEEVTISNQTLSDTVNGMVDTLGSLGDADAALGLRVSANEQNIQTHSTAIEETDGRLDATNLRVTALEEAESGVGELVGNLTTRVETVELTVGGFTEAIEGITETNIQIGNEQLSMRNELGDLKEEVFGSGEIPSLNMRIVAVELNASTLMADERDVFQGPHDW